MGMPEGTYKQPIYMVGKFKVRFKGLKEGLEKLKKEIEDSRSLIKEGNIIDAETLYVLIQAIKAKEVLMRNAVDEVKDKMPKIQFAKDYKIYELGKLHMFVLTKMEHESKSVLKEIQVFEKKIEDLDKEKEIKLDSVLKAEKDVIEKEFVKKKGQCKQEIEGLNGKLAKIKEVYEGKKHEIELKEKEIDSQFEADKQELLNSSGDLKPYFDDVNKNYEKLEQDYYKFSNKIERKAAQDKLMGGLEKTLKSLNKLEVELESHGGKLERFVGRVLGIGRYGKARTMYLKHIRQLIKKAEKVYNEEDYLSDQDHALQEIQKESAKLEEQIKNNYGIEI